MDKIKVYLAGKIKPHGWRQDIIDIRNEFDGCDYSPNDERSINILKTSYIPFNDYCNITGPFFLSCDHSCYHGDNTHGMGIGKDYNCYCNDNFSEHEVIDICKTQIKRADMIIAYIDDNTCYGTLYELGLAKQQGKFIAIIFDTNKRKRDMWFISSDANYVTTLEEKDDFIQNAFMYSEDIKIDTIEKMKNIIKNWKEKYQK